MQKICTTDIFDLGAGVLEQLHKHFTVEKNRHEMGFLSIDTLIYKLKITSWAEMLLVYCDISN